MIVRTSLPKLIIILICIIILIVIAIFVEPPRSWQEASDFQLLGVFVPLLLIFMFSVDIFVKYLPRSFIVGLGLMFLFVLQAIGQLTPLIVVGVLAAAILAARLYPKLPPPRFLRRLTLRTKIPKLTKLERKNKH